MKHSGEKTIKKLVSEALQGFLDEDYPQSFDMDYFKSLTSFSNRIAYCQEHLERISSGSARIVYKIDDGKALKLAKNKKGLAQNEVEISHGQDRMTESIAARVIDFHPDSLWLEMELAKKARIPDFKRITGFDFDTIMCTLKNYYYENEPSRARGYQPCHISPETLEELWENEFFYDLRDYMMSYGVPVSDITHISSFGIVQRDWGEDIVLVDYGLSHDVYDTHYSR